MIFLLLLALMQDAATLSQQGAQAMRQQRYGEAERIYRELVKQDTANPAWHMNLGLALHSTGRYAEAVPELETFLKAKPEPGPVYLLLGLSRLKLSQACEAIPALEKARLWNTEKTLVELADAYYGCRRFSQAARTYEAALSTSLKNDAVRKQAGHCYWEARQYADARRMYSLLEKSLSEDGEFNYEYGDTLVRIEGPAAGLPYLVKAAAQKPNLWPARGELGKALQALGRASEAIPHLEEAAKADPVLLLPLSRAYRSAGRVDDANRTQAEYRQRVPN